MTFALVGVKSIWNAGHLYVSLATRVYEEAALVGMDVDVDEDLSKVSQLYCRRRGRGPDVRLGGVLGVLDMLWLLDITQVVR